MTKAKLTGLLTSLVLAVAAVLSLGPILSTERLTRCYVYHSPTGRPAGTGALLRAGNKARPARRGALARADRSSPARRGRRRGHLPTDYQTAPGQFGKDRRRRPILFLLSSCLPRLTRRQPK